MNNQLLYLSQLKHMVELYQFMYKLCLLNSVIEGLVKEKSTSGLKKTVANPNLKNPTVKSLKYQEKREVSPKFAMGFPNGAISAAFRVAFNDTLSRTTKEKETRSDDFEKYYASLSKKERQAINDGFQQLKNSMSMDEYFNSARQNNIIGLGVFEVEKSFIGFNKRTEFQFSADSINTIDGIIEQSPAVQWCFVMCNQSIYNASQNGLHSLVFRVKRFNQIMMLKSQQFQNLSNEGQIPVMIQDVYNRRKFLWRPE